MKGLRLLNNGEWNKPPVLTAARRVFALGLAKRFPQCTLGDAASFVNGTSYNVDRVSTLAPLPIIRISNLTDPTSAYIRTDEELGVKFWIRPGDLLVSWSASFKSALWAGPEGYLNQHIFKVTENSGFDRCYIRHIIEASFDAMQERVVGIGMMHLRRADFLGHRVPAPPLSIQAAVAAYLDWMEGGRIGTEPPLPSELTEQRRVVARIEELAGQIQEARRIREHAAGEVGAITKAHLNRLFGNPYESTAGMLHVERWAKIDEVVEDVADGPHVTPTYVEQGVPFITALNITSGRIRFDNHKAITPEDHIQFQKRAKAEHGDVLITKDGTIGMPCFVDTDREFSFFVSVALIKAKRTVLDGEYLVWAFRIPYMQQRIAAKSRGDMIRHLVLREIRGLTIPVPSLAEQRQIVAELDALQAQVEALKGLQAETAAELDALLPTILDRAFLGKL